MAAPARKVISASDLKVGHRVLELGDDGERHPRQISDLFEDGEHLKAIFDDGGSSRFWRQDRVRIEPPADESEV